MNHYSLTYLHELRPGQLVAIPRNHRRPFEGDDAWIVVSVKVRDEVDWDEGVAEWFVTLHGTPQPPTVLELAPLDGGRQHLHLAYRAAQSGHRVKVLEEHYPKCSSCGDMWPCRHVSNERVVQESRWAMDAACAHCGKSVSGSREGQIRTETPDGVVTTKYHTRKGSPCRRAYLAAVEGDPIALSALRREDASYARFRNGGTS